MECFARGWRYRDCPNLDVEVIVTEKGWNRFCGK